MNPSNINEFQDAVVTVMGLGRYKQGSGIGATKWLMRHGAQVLITDLKTEEELRDSVEEITHWYDEYRLKYKDRDIYSPVFVLGEHHDEHFEDVDLVVQNPGVSSESKFLELAEKNNVMVESDVSLFFRLYPHPICAVTGTRGKSTTAALAGGMLKSLDEKALVAGNIITSPLEYLDDLLEKETPTPVVIELTSWHIESLGGITRGPEIAALTNIYEDHLNRYASFEAYIASKEQMFHHQSADQKAVLNADHDLVRQMGERIPSEIHWFSKNKPEQGIGAWIQDGNVMLSLDGNEEVVLPVSEIKLHGEHNQENVLAAILVSALAGVGVPAIATTLREFSGLPGRQEFIEEKKDVVYVNDTTAISPDGTIAALERFGGKKNMVLIVGGMSENVDIESLVDAIEEYVKHVIFLKGELSTLLKEKLNTVPSEQSKTVKDAVKKAAAVAKEGDMVLFSPATASSKPYRNEFERGEDFVTAAKAL